LNRKKKILITGGAGFIGSHAAQMFNEKGFDVAILDNYCTGFHRNILRIPDVKIYEGDVNDFSFVEGAILSFLPNVVLHAAGSYKDSEDWNTDVSTNINGTINVVRVLQKLDDVKLIYLQTSLCYGLESNGLPTTTSQPYFDGNYKGGSSYAITKTCGELFIDLSGVNFVSLRLANVYGPKNFSGPIPTFFNRISNKKLSFIYDTRRDFIFVEDVVECIFSVASSQSKNEKYYNVSSGIDYSIEEIFNLMTTLMGDDSALRSELRQRGADDTDNILIDAKTTQIDFNWKAKTPLIDGLRRTIDYYKENSNDKIYSHLNLNET
jgi:UDP-glucose 4-epimerase